MISTMHAQSISAQKDIYRDFLRSLDVSVVPAHGTIKMYQNLFADLESVAYKISFRHKVRDSGFLRAQICVRGQQNARGYSMQMKMTTTTKVSFHAR